MILFFDTETTGKLDFQAPLFAPHQPNLVQLAGMLCDFEGRSYSSFSFIVRPIDWQIPAEASAIHGIKHETAEQLGLRLETVIATFHRFAAEATLLVAHNFAFDERILAIARHRLLQDKNPIKDKPFFCTMQSTTKVCKIAGPQGRPNAFKWPKLSELHHFLFSEPFENAHDAMGDVRATARCYFELQRRGLGFKWPEPPAA